MTILTPKEKKRARQLGARKRLRPNTITGFDVPLRNEDDADGNPFLGFDRRVIAFEELTDAELADNAVTGRVAAPQFLDISHFPITGGDRRIPAGVRFALGDALGTLDVAQLGGGGAGHLIDKDLIPGIGQLNGSLGFGQITGNLGFHRIDGKLPAGRISGKIAKSNISGVNWDQVDNKPLLAGKHYVDKGDADVKAWAKRTFQAKPK